MPDGRVEFEITGDNKKIRQSLDEVTQQIEKAGKSWDKSVEQSSDDIQKSMSKAFDVERVKNFAIQAGKALVDFGKGAIQAASDLEEVQNVVDVTFGAGASQIDAWAKTAQSQFGLTETQAKRFTSTLGAMMKSAGLAGPEIVGMSEDLAGLAADMASFYNLDFDTAFQKIRSGIAGETEPLRTLGINMSVANLEAFALTQGITKAFDKMSQGEQTMLRYQYLMQATADAQGDFARTSDGYANSLRQFETNVESLKTNLGQVLLPVVSEVVAGLNGLLGELVAPPEETIFDQLAAIDLKTDEKIKAIQETAAEATSLSEILDELADNDAGAAMESIANGANVLNSNSPTTWNSLLTALESVDGLENVFGTSSAGDNVRDLAQALSGASVDTDKAEAWQTLLGALSANAEALSTLTGTSAEDTAAWLGSLADAAAKLDPSTAEGWDTLLADLVKGLPGLENTPEGQAFFEAIAGELLAMGNQSDEAREKLLALGMSSDDIDKAQERWLDTCNRLVRTIPGLSKIINTQTGEVEGGTEAIRDYIAEASKLDIARAQLDAVGQKRQAILDTGGAVNSLQVEMMMAEKRLERVRQQLADAGIHEGEARESREEGGGWFESERHKTARMLGEDLVKAEKDLTDATAAFNNAAEAQAMDLADLDAVAAELNAEVDSLAESTGGASEGLTDLELAAAGDADALERLSTASQEALDALTAVADYAEATREETAKSISSVVGGLQMVQTPAQKTRAEMQDLTAQIKELNAAGKDTSGVEKTFSSLEDSIPTAQNMTKALESQLQYMKDYQDNMAKAEAAGVNQDLLASLADGSVESADYLAALASASQSEIEELNKAWTEAQTEQEAFTDALTGQKLKADETFQGLVDTANTTMTKLDKSGAARAAGANTVQGLINGLQSMQPVLAAQVDALVAQLDRLSTYGGFSVSGGSISMFSAINGSHEAGLDRVPFDNYLAVLHEGETILPAEEAQMWRNFRSGAASSRNGIDYGALSGAIWDNAPSMGGNVYLDGRTVGRVISQQQAITYRQMERSGWQG